MPRNYTFGVTRRHARLQCRHCGGGITTGTLSDWYIANFTGCAQVRTRQRGDVAAHIRPADVSATRDSVLEIPLQPPEKRHVLVLNVHGGGDQAAAQASPAVTCRGTVTMSEDE
jgi:hypothetical protein